MYAPSKPGDQPSVEVSKEFMMSPNKLHLGKNEKKKIHRSVLFTLPSYVIRLDSNVYCGQCWHTSSTVPVLTHTHEHFGFRMFAGQGVVLPRGDDIRQCPHPGDHTIVMTRLGNLHVALIFKVRSHICKMHRNVLNALFKVEGFNKFMSELFWRFVTIGITRLPLPVLAHGGFKKSALRQISNIECCVPTSVNCHASLCWSGWSGLQFWNICYDIHSLISIM